MNESKVRHVVSVSGGKDSDATLKIALNRCPPGTVIPIFCDTDNEDRRVYEHLDYLERTLGVKIPRLKADFSEEFARKRMFIARDQRRGRKYETAPVVDAAGLPVPKRDAKGSVVMREGAALRPSAEFSRAKIEMIVEWSRTTRGGRQLDLLAIEPESLDACASAYGLCE